MIWKKDTFYVGSEREGVKDGEKGDGKVRMRWLGAEIVWG